MRGTSFIVNREFVTVSEIIIICSLLPPESRGRSAPNKILIATYRVIIEFETFSLKFINAGERAVKLAVFLARACRWFPVSVQLSRILRGSAELMKSHRFWVRERLELNRISYNRRSGGLMRKQHVDETEIGGVIT